MESVLSVTLGFVLFFQTSEKAFLKYTYNSGGGKQTKKASHIPGTPVMPFILTYFSIQFAHMIETTAVFPQSRGLIGKAR